MAKITPKKSNYQQGVKLIIDIEVDGVFYKLAIPCPNCKENSWFLNEDKTYAYCGNCHQHIGYINSDMAIKEGITWNI